MPAAPSCHASLSDLRTPTGTPVIAIVGQPNVGKSTLFNALTGASVTMGNWPGTTVEVARARAMFDRTEVQLIDLPGAYSLDPRSPDEEVTRALVTGEQDGRVPDAVIALVNGAHVARSLYLVRQLREIKVRVVLAITMTDVAAARGVTIDTAAMSAATGVPVVLIDPRRRRGLAELRSAVVQVLDAPAPSVLDPHGCDCDHAENTCTCGGHGDDALALADERFAWIAGVVDAAVVGTPHGRKRWSDRFDAIALSPVFGPLVFLAAMWAVFQLTTTVAAPLQDLLDAFFAGPVSDAATLLVNAVGLGDTWVRGLVIDGLIAGVGMLLTFVPLMAIMFLLLAVLEDSGYLARAAVVTDRLMRAMGLPGRAFLPLIVGFGCNVPAISATRILPNTRQRIMTSLLVPFTSCTARLTVYVFIATIFFPSNAGTVVFVMYLISIVFVVLVGLALRKTLWRTMGTDSLVIDLPPYQWPTLRLMWAVTWVRLRGFLRTASGIIVATIVAVWFLQAMPASGEHAFGDVPVQDSLYASASTAISPVFEPAGFASWPTTGALIVGFVAKEAVISSWAQTYALAEPQDAAQPGDLGTAIMADFDRSSDGHPALAAWAFMIFLLAYTPCVATLATQWREIGARWTGFGIIMQLAVAWVAAVAVFQIGSRLL